MEPRSGGGWLRVGGRVVGSCILESPSGGLGGAPATLAGAQGVGPRPFLKLFPPLLEVSKDLPPPAFPLWALAEGVRGVGGATLRARAKGPMGRGAAGGAGRRLRLSFLWSLLLLFVECWVSPTPSIREGERKETVTVGPECKGKPNNM